MKMKEFQKMTRTEFAVFCFMAMCAGGVIGIGGAASLVANSLLGGWGKLVGACLFSLGIYVIVAYEMKLFTGMVADIPTLGVKNYWQLPVCFLGNVIGIAIIAFLAGHSFLGETVVAQGRATILSKLETDGWGGKAFCSAILCGALITLSVKAKNYAPQKGLSTTVGVIFPIIVFAFCGFDHSVANMMYFFYLGEFSWRVFGYIFLSFLGNIVGGVILPMITLFKEKGNRQKVMREKVEKQNG